MNEQAYDHRVRALEDELGVSTSDAQAMVDAEDLVTTSAPQTPPNTTVLTQSDTLHAHRLPAVISQAD
jgi:hypothetical protein